MTPRIRIDDRTSPAVTFATLPSGATYACAPDGSYIIGSMGRPTLGEPGLMDVLAVVRIAHRGALSGRAGVA